MEELDLKEIFNIFWKRKISIIVIFIVIITMGIIHSYFMVEPKYTSYTTALLKPQNVYLENGEKVNETNLQSFLPTYVELVKSNVVIKETIEELDIENLDVGNIEVIQIINTEMVKIIVKNSNPEHAAKVANKLVDVANKKIKELYEIEIEIHIIDEAEATTVPNNIDHKKEIIKFTFIGIIIACGYALLMNTIKDK